MFLCNLSMRTFTVAVSLHHCFAGKEFVYLISASKYTSNFPITTGEISVLCQTDSCVNGFRRDVKSFFNVNDSVDGLMDRWMVGRWMMGRVPITPEAEDGGGNNA